MDDKPYKLEKMINWDELHSEVVGAVASRTSQGLRLQFVNEGEAPNLLLPDAHFIPRPATLKDGAWYCFIFDNPANSAAPLNLVGKYRKEGDILWCAGSQYSVDSVKITVTTCLDDSNWEGELKYES